jgi:hypothetical protein
MGRAGRRRQGDPTTGAHPGLCEGHDVILAAISAIDALVYELYGLTDEEIRIVEGS